MQVRGAIKNPAYKSVGVYIFTNFFSKGISFILIPLFTNPIYLTPVDNGKLSLFSSNMLLLAPIISLGMIQSSAADFYKQTKKDFSNSFTSNFFIAGAMAFLSTVVLFIFRNYLSNTFEFPSAFVYVIPFLAFMVFASEQLFALIRNRNEVKNFAVIGLTKSLLEYSISVILIVFLFKGWEGRVWGIAISLIAVNIYGIFYYSKHKYLDFTFHKSHVWNELKFGVPVFVFQSCVFMLGSSNKLFLAIFNVDKHELGIYSIACILGSMVGTISQSIMLYVQPQLYKSISKGEATFQSVKKDYFRYFKMFTFISTVCILIALFAYYFLINKIYISGLPYFFLTALSSYIWGLTYFLFLFLLYHKEKRKILIVSLISIVCSITINVIMVKNYLILGDALSGLMNTILFTGLIIVFSRKIINKTLRPGFNTKRSI